MSAPNKLSTENGQVGAIILILIIFLVLALAGGRHYFGNTGHDIRTTVHDAGQDLKSTGRDAAASIRDAVQ